MLSETFARHQLMRLSGLRYFETLQAAPFAELVAIARSAATEAACEAAISALLEDLDERPTPRQLRIAIEAQNQNAPQLSGDGAYCDRCRHGRPPGWITLQRSHGGQMYDYAGKCPACNPGWYTGGSNA